MLILAADLSVSDLGLLWEDIDTPDSPNLDALAAKGLKFTQFYDTTARRWPATAPLLTRYYAEQVNRDSQQGAMPRIHVRIPVGVRLGLYGATRESVLHGRTYPALLGPQGHRYHSGKCHQEGTPLALTTPFP